jgi:GxxExxY protein
MPHHVNVLTGKIINSAIEIHRSLGPGLLESAYHNCLARELELSNIPFSKKLPVRLAYKGIEVKAYVVDLLVADTIVVEVKSIAAIAPIHEAQLLTYMRIGGWQIGLLLNFNVMVLKNGIRRKVLNFNEEES